MKRRIRRLALAAIVAAVPAAATLSSVAHAQAPGEPGPPPPGDARGPGRRPPPFADMLERNAERLGLDEKTRAEVRSIADAAREESRRLEDGLRVLHDELRKLLDQPTPDLEAALQQADRIGAAETELHKLRLRTMLQIRGLLTPEQRQELVRIHEERRRERGRMPPPGAPPPDGSEPGAPPPGPPPDVL